jgi:hypothetical protein
MTVNKEGSGVMATGSKGFGTTSIQLRERKNGILVPKRHLMKHLDFLILWFGTRGLGLYRTALAMSGVG